MNGLYTANRVNWLVIFSIFASAYVFFRTPFEFYFFYIPVILLAPVFLGKFPLERGYLLVLVMLGISGLWGLIIEANTLPSFLKVYLSIVVMYTFYYYAFAFNKFRVDGLFKLYADFSYIVALIGVFQFASSLIGFTPGYDFRWFLNKWTLVHAGGFLRINSVISEPSQLAFVLAPVIFISIYNLMNKKVFLFSKGRSCVFILVSLLTLSTHSYVIVAFSIVLNFFRRISLFRAVSVLFVLLFIGAYVYQNFSLVRSRVDDSFLIVSEIEKSKDRLFLAGLNSSSFTLLNNYIVTLESFKNSPLFGGGLGSHPVSFEKYSLTKSIYLPFLDFNKADANSLFLRLVSETGLFGVSIFLFLMIKFRVRSTVNMKRWIISHSILVMMIAGFLREGHYFHSGVPFFIFAYIFNYRQNKIEASSKLLEQKNLMTSERRQVHFNYGGSR